MQNIKTLKGLIKNLQDISDDADIKKLTCIEDIDTKLEVYQAALIYFHTTDLLKEDRRYTPSELDIIKKRILDALDDNCYTLNNNFVATGNLKYTNNSTANTEIINEGGLNIIPFTHVIPKSIRHNKYIKDNDYVIIYEDIYEN